MGDDSSIPVQPEDQDNRRLEGQAHGRQKEKISKR